MHSSSFVPAQLDRGEAWSTPFFVRITNFFRASISLNLFDFEPSIILHLFLNTKVIASPKSLRIVFQSFLCLLHHKTKQELIFGIDNAEVHLKVVLSFLSMYKPQFWCRCFYQKVEVRLIH